MITTYNSENYAQSWFLTQAYEALKENNALVGDLSLDDFKNLKNYFAYMGNLMDINPRFALIPTDEQPCVINANDRTIKLPKEFATCAGVVGDTMCEIVTFTIDRYFDYVDLATTLICVQWITPDKKEGISKIGLIDTDTEPGKIRFGWPLTHEVTQVAGNVEFQVRFYSRNTNDTEHKYDYFYVLGTLPTKLPIKPGIVITDPLAVEEDASNVFAKFVLNSMNPSFATPDTPTFGNNGVDLSDKPYQLEGDQATLSVRAHVLDNGYLDYHWYYKGLATELDQNVERLEITEDLKDERFTVKLDDMKQTQDKVRRPGVQYYTLAGLDAYEPYLEKEFAEGGIYYEKYATLKINPGVKGNIVGEYWATVSNQSASYEGPGNIKVTTVTGEEVEVPYSGPTYNKVPAVESTHASFPAPKEITALEENLSDDIILKNNASTVLTVKPIKDDGNPVYTYTWYSSTTSDEDGFKKIDNAAGSSLTVVNPGWYYANVMASLNRYHDDIDSVVCRVVNTPTITYDDVVFKYRLEGSDEEYDISTLEDSAAMIKAGDTVKIGINLADTFKDNKLRYDEIKYEWHVIEPEKGDRVLTEQDKSDEELTLLTKKNNPTLNAPWLEVRCLKNVEDSNITEAYAFYCVITIKLAETEAVYGKNQYDNDHPMFIIK